ncbi:MULTISPECIES: rSAM-modified peptide [Flavobacterium]|uniref:RSAM-modified peptide n=1 Tax=Flavobacterium endoglycinae TaxID=2816357 RepID=A0ABX7QIY8_9FLAO|nr:MULTISPECIES: rSAM-modified peptide [Flavobacterium]QSW91041.1 rSAM-modified peptide [Flavobacterium endoglycinae]
MATMNFKLEDFEVEKLTKNQQKKVRGGDEVTTSSAPVDPGKKDTNGNV